MQFQIVDLPASHPQKDILGFTDGPLIDTGIELDRASRIYLGSRAVREVLRLVAPDMCPIAERDEALERAKGADARADTAEAQSKERAGSQAEYDRTRDELVTTKATLASLQTKYAELRSGGIKSPQERLIEAAKPEIVTPKRKRARASA